MRGRGQRSEDRRQTVVYRYTARFRKLRGRAATTQSSVLCPLSSERGFTLFELVVVVIIILMLIVFFLDRARYYQEQAEKTAMEVIIGTIQSSLTLQYGQVITRGKPSDVAALMQDNPINWLQKKPLNYAGEFYDLTPLAAEGGNWAFDLKSHHLVYLLRNSNHFIPGTDGKRWIRFHVVVDYLPSLHNQPPEPTGIAFEPIEPYSWFR